MEAKVIFKDDGNNVIISTEGALAERGTVAQNAAMAVFNQFTRGHKVKTGQHLQSITAKDYTKAV